MSLTLLITIQLFSFSAKAAENNLGWAISFDQFIDKSSGDELKKSDAEKKLAYRAKRVNKSIFKWINLAGYYESFKKDFKDWCEANSGKFRQNQFNDADCISNTWLGAYNFEITTTATYQGDMTAGFVIFYFYGPTEMAQMNYKKLEIEQTNQLNAIDAKIKQQQYAEAAVAESQRQSTCRNSLAAYLRNNLNPGVKTNLGMIIEIKPPLAYVQNLSATPPTRWVEVNDLQPPLSSNYCAQ